LKISTCLPIVPARSGSIGVKHKNVEILGDLPLFLHSVSFAYRNFGQCCFTSDSRVYFELYRDFLGSEAEWEDCQVDEVVEIKAGIYFHKRSVMNAQVLSPINQVLYKIARSDKLPRQTSHVLMLQPTSPFRWDTDVQDLVTLSENSNWSSIFSVRPVGGHHPNRMYYSDKESFGKPYENQSSQDNIPRQQLTELYIKDGSYYLFKLANLLREVFIGERPLLFIRDNWPHVNIDTLDDMKLAKILWNGELA
jgi:CMP-N,N'-diacetyllegionaminic acid synthase